MTRRPTRTFLQKAVAGAGATAAAALGGTPASAMGDSAAQDPVNGVPPIRVPKEFAAGSAADPIRFEFPMTGAQVFARACKEEGVAALFACPGNYPVVHALATAGISAFGGRHEGLAGTCS